MLRIIFSLSSEDPRQVTGPDYQGYIFPKEYGEGWLRQEELREGPYTPTDMDVEFAEKHLAQQLPALNKERNNQGPMR